MELSSKPTIILEVKQGDNKYQFLMPVGSGFGEAYDACHLVLQEIVKFATQAAQAVKQKETDNAN